MSIFALRSVRLRLWWTSLLVVIALAGAGLSVAADRPHDSAHRPELFLTAERQSEPIITALVAGLEELETDVGDLSQAGRDTLGRLQALDLDGAAQAIDAGDEVAATIAETTRDVATDRAAAQATIETWRLGPRAREVLDGIDAAIVAASELPVEWSGLASHARDVHEIVSLLLRHDSNVIAATRDGRRSRWEDAKAALDNAESALARVIQIRDRLPPEADSETLSELIDRYETYDRALFDLYDYLSEGGRQSGAEFERREAAVATAQAALPTSEAALAVVVGGTAAPTLGAALVEIEEARGAILDAISAASEGAEQ